MRVNERTSRRLLAWRGGPLGLQRGPSWVRSRQARPPITEETPTKLHQNRQAEPSDRPPAALPKPDGYWPKRLERRRRSRPQLHFRRIELKYIVPERFLEYVVERVSPWTDIDPYLVQEGNGRASYPVTSLYFDSFDLHSLAEKEAGHLLRRKIRLRTYEELFREEDICFLEIKRRLDSVVIKDRISLPPNSLVDAPETPGLLRGFLERVEDKNDTWMEAQVMMRWFNLQPTALVRYLRYPFVGKEDPSTRVTIDRNLQGLWNPPAVAGALALRGIDNIHASGMAGISGRYAILELKCNHTIPGWWHGLVTDLELGRTAFSKYFMVAAALRPELVDDYDSSLEDIRCPV